jgi:hypothetical protein
MVGQLRKCIFFYWCYCKALLTWAYLEAQSSLYSTTDFQSSIPNINVFFRNYFMQRRWLLGDTDNMAIIPRQICKFGYNLAKSGYKPHMKHKTLILFLYFWLLIGRTKCNDLAKKFDFC